MEAALANHRDAQEQVAKLDGQLLVANTRLRYFRDVVKQDSGIVYLIAVYINDF